MTRADEVVERLAGDPGHLDELVRLMGDHVFRRPLREVVEPDRVAEALAELLRAGVRDTATADWVRERLGALASRPPPANERPLGRRLPPEAVRALEDLVRRPYTPDQELLHSVLDHPAMRKALRNVLQDSLLGFAAQAASLLPDILRVPGGKGLSQLMGVARGMAGAVTGEAQRVLERRVSDFVDQIIGRAADIWIDSLGSDRLAPELGDWRADLVRVVLDQPPSRFRGQLARTDLDQLVADVTALLRALAEWDGLEDEVETLLGEALARAGDRSMAEVLEGSGVEAAWQAQWEATMRPQVASFVQGEAFRGWLARVLD